LNNKGYRSKVAVVGGGRALKLLLKVLETIHNDSGPSLDILAVADVNPNAPGLEYARQKGISTFIDYHEMIEMEGLDFILELTGQKKVREALLSEIPPGVSIVDHRAAKVMWDLMELGETRIKQLRKEAHAQKLTAVEEMATYITHEIRNPLMALGGFAQSLISMECLKDEDCLARTQVIVEEARRLESVFRNIWELTRPLTVNVEQADFNQVVRDAIELFRQDLESANIKVNLSQDQEIPLILFDPYLIKQACLNILKNAIESMPEGGEITIITEMGWDYILFRCIDQGSGIKKENLHSIYNPFFTTKEGALGLGLAMARKIIEDHEGVITVTAREGKGTTVEFRLMLEPSSSSPPLSPTQA